MMNVLVISAGAWMFLKTTASKWAAGMWRWKVPLWLPRRLCRQISLCFVKVIAKRRQGQTRLSVAAGESFERTCRSFGYYIPTTHRRGNRKETDSLVKEAAKESQRNWDGGNCVSCRIRGGPMETPSRACCLTTCWSVKKYLPFYEHVCGHMYAGCR